MASMSYRELVALFRKNGIEFVRAAKGDHEIWFSPITRRKLTVPRKLKGEGTLQRILRDSGLKDERDRDDAQPLSAMHPRQKTSDKLERDVLIVIVQEDRAPTIPLHQRASWMTVSASSERAAT